MDDKWRYYVLTCNENGDLIEIASFKTGDTAALFVEAMRKEFCELFPDLELEIEDVHQPLSFKELMEADVDG